MSSTRFNNKYFFQQLLGIVHYSKCLKYISNKTKSLALLELTFRWRGDILNNKHNKLAKCIAC